MKTKLFLVLVLLVPAFCLTAQENKASMLLSSAVYEEEVSGNLTKAADLYLDLIRKYPDARPEAAKALYHLGLITEKMGKQKAGDYFARLVSNYPDQKELVALARERLAKSESVSTAATMKAELVFRQATELYNQLKYDAAAAEYEKVIAMVPKSALAQEAQLWVGQCQYRLGKYDLAVTSFKTTIKDYPQSTVNPVTEMLIGQAEKAKLEFPKKRPAIAIDDWTILDPETGIRYTKIQTWAGKNDIMTSASLITGIAPNRKFLLYDNQVIPFDNSDSFSPIVISRVAASQRLSPDGTRVAYFTENGISVVPVSTESGMLEGPAKNLVNCPTNVYSFLNWAPDGKSIVYSSPEMKSGASIMTIPASGGDARKVTRNFLYGGIMEPAFSSDGSKLFYRELYVGGLSTIRMHSLAISKSVGILDSVEANYGARSWLSHDNKWILTNNGFSLNRLYRLSDKQTKEFSIPEEVGELVDWTAVGNNFYTYKSSYQDVNLLKMVSVFGGPAYEFSKPYGQFAVAWTPDGNSIISESREGRYPNYRSALTMINLTDQSLRPIEGLSDYNDFNFSPDLTKVVVRRVLPATSVDLILLSFSAKESETVGKPITLIKGFTGRFWYEPWSPDGKKIVYTQAGDIWIAFADGKTPIQLTNTPVSENYPTWSSDGGSLAVYSDTNSVRVIRSSDGELTRIIQKVDYWHWAPNGKELAVAFLDGRLEYVSAATGLSRKIANWKELSGCLGLNFLECSPDGKWIAINGYRDEAAYDVHMFLINTLTGTSTELDGDDTRYKDGILWSPDSKWIYFNTTGPKKVGMTGTLWEADLTDFMSRMKPGTEKGFTTDFDFSTHLVPAGGVPADGNFTDARDGHVYKYKKIGTQTWMTENLAYLPAVNLASDSSTLAERHYVYGYDGLDVGVAKSTVNYQKYGVLYNYTAATVSCPEGWHLPGDSAWMELEKNLGMDASDSKSTSLRNSGEVGQKLKSLQWPDDDIFTGFSGFNLLPGGYRQSILPYFKGADSMTELWILSSKNDPIVGARIIYSVSAGVRRTLTVKKTAGFSVRCVKDK